MTIKSITLDQNKQFKRFVEDASDRALKEINLDKESLQRLIERGGEFQSHIMDGIRRFSAKPPVYDLAGWERTYEKLYGKKPDFSSLVIPTRPEGFGPMRLIIVAREIVEWTDNCPLQGTQDALKKYFPCWQYESNLDETIPTSDRDPKNGSYAVWVRDVREADEEFANKSANDLKAEGHTGITVLERQLLEADYFFEKGEHLDPENVTMCSGSRVRGGCVPHAIWYGKFCVRWCNSTYRYPGLRSRRVWV